MIQLDFQINGYGLTRNMNRYKNIVENQWLTNCERTSNIIKEVTGLDFDNEQFLVYLTDDDYAHYLGKNRIEWGLKQKYKNFHTIGLWHEALHSRLGDGHAGHSIIQLAADNELRVRLTDGKYPPFKGGHFELFPDMEKILPFWMEYLTHKEKDILEFQKKMRRKFPTHTYDGYRRARF